MGGSNFTREKVQWLHDAATEFASTKMKMTMDPDEVLALTGALLAAMDSEAKEPISFDEWSRKCALQITLCYPDFREKAQYIWDSARETQHVAPVVPDKNGLLPCPFCGGEPEEDAGGCSEFHGHEHQDYSITCKQCGAEVYCSVGTFEKADVPCSCHHDTREVCVDKWNKRAAVLNQAPVKHPSIKPKSELLQRAEKLAEDTAALAQRVQCEDLRAKVRSEHAEWATATFGNTGPIGPLKHLSAEALEAAAAPDDLSEWADMQFLFWDAQSKAGISDEQITQAMVAKLQVNKARQWPEPKEGEPRFHIKDGE